MKNYKIKKIDTTKVSIELEEEERRQILKIYKDNAIIFGKDSTGKLTAFDLKVFNLIYKFVQDEVRQYKEAPIGHLTLTINQIALKTYLNIPKTYNHWKKDIEKSLNRLNDNKYELRNYVHPKLGTIEWYKLSLITLPKIIQKDKTGRYDSIEVVVPDLIVLSAWRKIKYTHIELEHIHKLTSKYSINLYEYILAYMQYNKAKNKSDEYLEFRFNELKNIFSKPNAKSLSVLLQQIRFDEAIVEINKILPCTYEIYKKDKILTIYFVKDEIKKIVN